MIDVGDLDDLVSETYGRRYDFQQQDGCDINEYNKLNKTQ